MIKQMVLVSKEVCTLAVFTSCSFSNSDMVSTEMNRNIIGNGHLV